MSSRAEIEKLKSTLANFTDKDFRSGQLEAVQWVLNSVRRIRVLCAPTGTGKTLLAVLAGMHFGGFLYLCSSKQLQTQIEHDFPEVSVMWGRGNFPCAKFPSLTAANCPYKSIQAASASMREFIRDCKADCPYEIQKRKVLNSKYKVLNYHYMLFESNFVGRFSDPAQFIICDEADTLESVLSGFITLKITARALGKFQIKPPKRRTSTAKDGIESWQAWAQTTGALVKRRINFALHKLDQFDPADPAREPHQHDLDTLDNLNFKIKVFQTHMDHTWLFDETKSVDGEVKSWEFKPTWLSPELATQYFWRHGSTFLMMSATFPPPAIIAKTLGIQSMADIDYTEAGAAFPAANRPVYLQPSGDMSFKTFERDLPGILVAVSAILDKYPISKGVIHTVNYKLNQAVMTLANPRLITHNADNKLNVLQGFMDSAQSLVFVSPSSTRGLDLPDDLCRFQIICKAPFQSLADKIVNSRVYGSQVGSFWYQSDMAQEIVQAVGRGVRSDTDHCDTYILDRQAINRVLNQQSLFPRYWIQACEV